MAAASVPTTSGVKPARPAAPAPKPPSSIAAWINHRLVPVFTALAILYLLTPIFVMIAFSFNDPPDRFNFVWGEFSLDAWGDPFGRLGLFDALVNSLIVGIGSTIVATILGTLVALALARYEFKGNRAVSSLIFVPMATPEIVMGASLLTLFVGTAFEPWKSLTGGVLFPLGVQTILVAHIMFNISYVIVTVRARMAGFDRRLEEAAMDLGANEWTTFWRVTFPLIFPGILAAALLAFSLSIDDFIITNFTSGISNTFPVWVWSSIRASLPPQIHVIGTAIFMGAILLVVISTLLQNRSARQAAAVRPT